jgi:hypothetical protein
VRVPGDPGIEISLEEPGPPLHDEATAAQLRELITKGAMSGLVFHTDDARGLYETFKARGVTGRYGGTGYSGLRPGITR